MIIATPFCFTLENDLGAMLNESSFLLIVIPSLVFFGSGLLDETLWLYHHIDYLETSIGKILFNNNSLQVSICDICEPRNT